MLGKGGGGRGVGGGGYLIFVTGTTGAARVKNSVGCKFFQIERKKTTYFTFLG